MLRAACLNEANRETLAQNGTLELAVGFIARARRSTEKATDREAVSAALFLLHTCSATANPRASIIEALASDVEPDGAIAGLFAMLDTDLANDAGAKLAAAHALSLLGNCAVDAKARIALTRFYYDAPGKIVGPVLPVLRCGTPVLAERAAALLGNMCADGRMRAEFAANERGISDLCALLPKNEKNERATAAPAGMGAGLPGLGARATDKESDTDASIDPSPGERDCELVLNVLAALANVSVDAAAAATIGKAGAAPRLARLLSRSSDPLVPARAATVLSRIARDPSTARGMCGAGGSNGDGVARRRWQSLWFGGSRQTPETARLNRRCGRSRFSPTAATRGRGSRWRSTPRGRWWSAFVVGTSSGTARRVTRRWRLATWRGRGIFCRGSRRSSRWRRCLRCATNGRARRKRTRRSRAPGWRRTRGCWKRSRRTTAWS